MLSYVVCVLPISTDAHILHLPLFSVRVLPSELVEQAFGMIPPGVTSQVRGTLADLFVHGKECMQRIAGSIPPGARQKLAGALAGANHTVTAIAGTASEVVRDLVKQWSH
jgi:hypothetical protein